MNSTERAHFLLGIVFGIFFLFTADGLLYGLARWRLRIFLRLAEEVTSEGDRARERIMGMAEESERDDK